jgi:hypothetical protein
MTIDKVQRHPFLDDLTDSTELSGTTLRHSVKGKAAIKRIVEATGTLYVSQTPTFFDSVGSRGYLGYEAVLTDGQNIRAVAVINRDDDGTVRSVNVTFSPLGAALSLSAKQRELLEQELGADVFL